MSRRLLVIAFHFPPIQGSSGVHRTLAFAKFLKDFDWDVTVLTVHKRAFDSRRDENLRMIPPHVDVVRATAWDAARHFAVRGWYPRALALPDRWQSWIYSGTFAGQKIIRQQRPAALLSTFPIASAHAIALRLHRATGLPWIADFRDPMAQDGYPTDPRVWRSYASIERQVFEQADRITVTTEGTAEYYAARYPNHAARKIRVIENGFDPDMFAAREPSGGQSTQSAKLLLLHSGIIYPRERDPGPFLRAIHRLREEGHVTEQTLEVRFRASGYEERYREMIEELGLAGIVRVVEPVAYDQALDEMQAASALLLFQAKSCNRQIPAKVYEYLYAGRPILGITDPNGDTGRLLARMGVPGIACLEDADAICDMLRETLPRIRDGQYRVTAAEEVARLSRRSRTEELANLLDEIATGRARPSLARDNR
jgi:glycosyltransferase involved in cell wall biosynthesis